MAPAPKRKRPLKTFRFMDLAPHLKQMVIRKLTIDNYHKFVMLGCVPDEDKDWIMDFDGNLRIRLEDEDDFPPNIYNPYTILRTPKNKKFFTLYDATQFNCLCDIKFRRIGFDNFFGYYTTKALGFLMDIGAHTEWLDFEMHYFERDKIYAQVVKSLRPKNIYSNCSVSVAGKIADLVYDTYIEKYQLDLNTREICEIAWNSFNCRELLFTFIPTDVEFMNDVINSVLRAKFNCSVSFRARYVRSSFEQLFELLKPRISVLYETKYHKYSIFENTKKRLCHPYYILISEVDFKKMWVFYTNRMHIFLLQTSVDKLEEVPRIIPSFCDFEPYVGYR